MSDKQRRGGLGRGLGALIPTGPARGPSAIPPVGAAAVTPEAPEEGDGQAGGTGEESPSMAADFQPLEPVAVAAPVATQPVGPDESDGADPDDEAGTAAVSPEESGDTSAPEKSGNPSAPDEVRSGSSPDDRDGVDAGDEQEPQLDGTPQQQGPGDRLRPVDGATFAEIALDSIAANAKQPRQVFDEESLAELTHSIREFGVLQPIVVRPVGDRFEIVMGERRLRAAAAAGLSTVPAIVRTTADDAMLRDALLENIHRVQLNPLEEAAAYQQLLAEFGTTHEELASRIGRSRPQVSNTIRLLQLPVPVQRRVAAGVLSAGHARALLGLDDGDAQEELAARIVAEGLSVRATEELVALRAAGHDRLARRRAASARITAPAISELADRLSDAFDTRVKVELGRRKGKISVEFASVDDLQRIIELMAPQVAERAQAGSLGRAETPAQSAGDESAGGESTADPASVRD